MIENDVVERIWVAIEYGHHDAMGGYRVSIAQDRFDAV